MLRIYYPWVITGKREKFWGSVRKKKLKEKLKRLLPYFEPTQIFHIFHSSCDHSIVQTRPKSKHEIPSDYFITHS